MPIEKLGLHLFLTVTTQTSDVAPRPKVFSLYTLCQVFKYLRM